MEQAGLVLEGQGGDVEVGIGEDEALQRSLVAGVFVLAKGGVPAPGEAFEVGVGEGHARGGVFDVEAEEVLVEADGPELWRHGIGVSGPPGEELLRGVEDGAVCGQLEDVFGQGCGLLAGGVKGECLVGDEVVESGAVAVGHGAFRQQVVPGTDGCGLESLLRRQGLLELLVNLREKARQIPRGEVLARLGGGGGALHEAPTILLEVMPIPFGQQSVHQRHHRLGRLGDLRLQADDLLLGLVTLDIALQRELLTDGLYGLGVSLVLERALDDRLQIGDGGLGQALLHGLLDLFPLGVARAG